MGFGVIVSLALICTPSSFDRIHPGVTASIAVRPFDLTATPATMTPAATFPLSIRSRHAPSSTE